MQGGSGSGLPGYGRNPAPSPSLQHQVKSPSSSVSPSSSSSTHVALEQQQQRFRQQQQIGFRQPLQQQQFRKPEGEKGHLPYQSAGVHGVMTANNFPPSSSAHLNRSDDSPHQQHSASQNIEDNQNEIQAPEQNMRNPSHQAYLQYAFHAAQQHKSFVNNQAQQQGKMTMVGPSSTEQDIQTTNMKMQELMFLQAASQGQAARTKNPTEQLSHSDKQVRLVSGGQRGEVKPPLTGAGHFVPANVVRPAQTMQSQATHANIPNRQFATAQLKAVHDWALERGIDMSLPANANLIAQMFPAWQSRPLYMQKHEENNMTAQQAKQQAICQKVGNESSLHMNFVSNSSGHAGMKGTHPIQSGFISSTGSSNILNAESIQMQPQFIVQNNRDNQNDQFLARRPTSAGSGAPIVHPAQQSSAVKIAVGHGNLKNSGSEMHQMKHFREPLQLDRSVLQPGATSSNDDVSNQFSARAEPAQMLQQRIGFTKQQLHVLKAQILAFRRIRNMLQSGQGAMPEELLQAIIPPPLDPQPQQQFHQNRNLVGNSEGKVGPSEINNGISHASLSKNGSMLKELPLCKDEVPKVNYSQGISSLVVEHTRIGSCEKVEISNSSVKPEVEVEHANIQNNNKSESDMTKGKTHPVQSTTADSGPAKKSVPTSNVPAKDCGSTRKYHGPIFDFPFFMRKLDTFASAASANNTNLILAYDVNDLLYEEGTEVLVKRREDNIKKIGGLLAMNLEMKRIRPDLVLRLQIEERKLQLVDRQARLRDEVDHHQQEIMAMPDRPYRKFVKQCERQRIDLLRQIQLSQKVIREKQLKSIFQWRKKLLEAHWAIRDARTTRNRGVAKYHERMTREFSKRKDDDRNKRMEALKNNDVDRYREMLLEQQTNISGDAAQRYSVLSSFLTQTEEYIHKLGGKITAAKNHQEVEEAARAAAVAARSQGLSEEEVKSAAACAGEEVMIRNRFSEMNAPRDNSSINKYYNLAHAVNERVIKQPSMLRAGTLRDYQLVGLQWMLSLYNNNLNGILADEMGLGKTIQVMALIAYLMEYKGNYGPHLIIVPNAVLVNWKSELYNWLPSVSCLFYVGGKDQRSKLFSQEVCAMKFNILVTTYEFVMYDRSKLSKIDWKYIIIDEAQRMKNRESVLARDLDRYRCQRRLLLTGTPLQNDLKELWSLLNLLLPEVFDNRKAFHDWFSKPFQKDVPSHDSEEDDWLETEKKVIIIHRLHQILEPFMLRRRVEDVEGSLPRKVSIVLRCRMSAMQGAIYDWIKATGTIRVDPEDEKHRAQKNPSYQVKMYKNLNNKCMELRKACNHPLLNYPFLNDYSRDFLVRSCGKLWILDRILIKLQRTGHRVLLFSTMTKLLDILEEYLQWRHLVYRRIDGSTSLEDRESAIVDFNNPDVDCFIFLLSIRAAGRGLNLQTADTVVIYDPDPNPQNEEQAVARAHRIGQQREVKVIYMEAVVDKMPSYQKEDELRNGGVVDSEDDLAGKDRYIGSIESLIRSNIQQYKIDMADEVINAGRFDQRTTHEERRMTLETLLHDEERYQETVHDVPSLQEVNRMIARSDEEIELFDQMDEEFDWTGEMMKYYQVPKYLRAGSGEINALIASLSKKQSKNIFTGSSDFEVGDAAAGQSPSKSERRRMRPRDPDDKRYIYMELDDDDIEDSDASSEERIEYSLQEEQEVGEYEDDEFNTVTGIPQSNKDQSEDDGLIGNGDAPEPYQASDGRHNHLFEDADSGSSGSLRFHPPITPSTLQKFGSLSALDAKPDSISNSLMEELEEGEIAGSGDSHVDIQHSQSSIQDRDNVDDEHVLQPKLKRKRSIRCRSRYTLEKTEESTRSDRVIPQYGSQLPLQLDQDFGPGGEASNMLVSNRLELDSNSLSSKSKSNFPSRKVKASSTPSLHTFSKSNRSNCFPGSAEDAAEHSGGSWSSKASRNSSHNLVKTKLPDTTQRKCKSVISKFQRRVDNEGHQTVPIIFDFWRSSVISATKNLLDPRKIGQHAESFKYSSISDFVADVQLMLKNLVRHFCYSHEVILEVRKLHDLFFDILKAVFPDTDFRSARHAVTFLDPGGPVPVLSPKYSGSSINKHHRRNRDIDSKQVSVKVSRRVQNIVEDDLRPQGYISKIPKESKSTAASQGVPVCSPLFRAHPGDLVICKGKRKDREKSAALQRVGPAPSSTPVTRGLVSPTGMGRGGPSSPANKVRFGSASSTTSGRSARLPLQNDQNQGQQTMLQGGWARQRPPQIDGVGGISPVTKEVQWAKPVKRTRTDTGKRRPSHL